MSYNFHLGDNFYFLIYFRLILNRFSIHLCVTQLHTKPGVADKFLEDVRNSLEEILKQPGKPVEGKVSYFFLMLFLWWFV